MSSINDTYRKKYEKYGVDSRSLHWHSEKAAKQRYVQIVSDIDFSGKTILDVGCGFGDIIPYIKKESKEFEYTGVDVMPEFIEEAKKIHSEYTFLVKDYFNEPIDNKFDIVMCSGALNSNVDDNLSFRKDAIKTMYEHAQEVMVFNMAGKYPQPKTSATSNVWFADPLEILEYCMTLTPKVILRKHYHSREFTIVMIR